MRFKRSLTSRSTIAAAAALLLVLLPIGVGGTRSSAASSASTTSLGRPTGSSTESDLLTAPGSSDEVVARLGSNLAEAARRNKKTEVELRRSLRDRSANLDRKGRLFFVDSAVPVGAAVAQGLTVGGGATLSGPVALYSDTFLLHSRPGSLRTIYLDFDGQAIANTAWNASYTSGASFIAEPFDTDGLPASFSNDERDVLQRVWQRVAEDYSVFDIDVTTQEPPLDAITRSSATDLVYGTRLVVSNTNTIYSSCGCGGLAYVGAFDDYGSHSYYQPAFVFQRGVTSNPKYLAEAASHEVGHNLGLQHDGTSTSAYYNGQGSWAPIMGAGYYNAVTQFSKGEYANANNIEDDFAVIQTHGGSLVTDDFGNGMATATNLGSPTNFTFNGLITTATDVDAFVLSSEAGTLSVSASPSTMSPNLDLKVTLLNSVGTVVASADPPSSPIDYDSASGLDASVSTAVSAGVYYVLIEGVGVRSPTSTGYSDYGSVGRYSVTGTLTTATTTAPTTTAPTVTTTTTTTTTAPAVATTTTKAATAATTTTTTTTKAPTAATTTRAPATTTTRAPTRAPASTTTKATAAPTTAAPTTAVPATTTAPATTAVPVAAAASAPAATTTAAPPANAPATKIGPAR